MIKRKRINVRFGDIHLQLNIELLFAVVYPVTGGVSGYCSRNPESLILNVSRVSILQFLSVPGFVF